MASRRGTPGVTEHGDGYRARYRDAAGRQHQKNFRLKKDAVAWLEDVKSSLRKGTYQDPKSVKVTVAQWCETWLAGYHGRPGTIRAAKAQIAHIVAAFGERPLASVLPSEVKQWTKALRDAGMAPSTVYVIYKRLGQIYTDAVHDGIVTKSPVSRRTTPGGGQQRPYVATTDQVWALYDAMDPWMRPAVLLGAFVGLRVAEAVALRVEDVDFMRGIVKPAIQYPNEELKTETSKTPVPIPRDLAVMLNRNPSELGATTIVSSEWGRGVSTSTFEDRFREAREKVEGLPAGFRFHDLRHYFASLLIAKGLDVKVVQKRMRHGSAKTTLDVYGHLFHDKDESSREAIQSVLDSRVGLLRAEGTGTEA